MSCCSEPRFTRHCAAPPTVAIHQLTTPVLDTTPPRWRTLARLTLLLSAALLALQFFGSS